MKNFFAKLSLIAIALGVVLTAQSASAANVAVFTDALSSTALSAAGVTHTINFTLPTAIPAAGNVTLGWTQFVKAGAFTFAVDITSTLPGAAIVAQTANTVTLSTTGAPAGAYNIVVSGAGGLDNPAAAQPIPTVTLATSAGDFGASLAPVANGNIVTVTAQVLPTLTMALSSNAFNFGALTPGLTADPAGVETQVTVSTNAANGYTLFVADDAAVDLSSGLSRTGATSEMASVASSTPTFVAGTSAGFAVYAATVSAGATIDAGYDDNGVADIAVPTAASQIATAIAPALNHQIDVNYQATAIATTPSGNYTTQLTYTLTGTF